MGTTVFEMKSLPLHFVNDLLTKEVFQENHAKYFPLLCFISGNRGAILAECEVTHQHASFTTLFHLFNNNVDPARKPLVTWIPATVAILNALSATLHTTSDMQHIIMPLYRCRFVSIHDIENIKTSLTVAQELHNWFREIGNALELRGRIRDSVFDKETGSAFSHLNPRFSTSSELALFPCASSNHSDNNNNNKNNTEMMEQVRVGSAELMALFREFCLSTLLLHPAVVERLRPPTHFQSFPLLFCNPLPTPLSLEEYSNLQTSSFSQCLSIQLNILGQTWYCEADENLPSHIKPRMQRLLNFMTGSLLRENVMESIQNFINSISSIITEEKSNISASPIFCIDIVRKPKFIDNGDATILADSSHAANIEYEILTSTPLDKYCQLLYDVIDTCVATTEATAKQRLHKAINLCISSEQITAWHAQVEEDCIKCVKQVNDLITDLNLRYSLILKNTFNTTSISADGVIALRNNGTSTLMMLQMFLKELKELHNEVKHVEAIMDDKCRIGIFALNFRYIKSYILLKLKSRLKHLETCLSNYFSFSFDNSIRMVLPYFSKTFSFLNCNNNNQEPHQDKTSSGKLPCSLQFPLVNYESLKMMSIDEINLKKSLFLEFLKFKGKMQPLEIMFLASLKAAGSNLSV